MKPNLIERIDRINPNKLLKWGIFAGVTGLLLWLSAVIGVVYVAWHFISKYW